MKLVFVLILLLFCVFTEIKCGWKHKEYWRNIGQNSNSNKETFKVTKVKHSNNNSKRQERRKPVREINNQGFLRHTGYKDQALAPFNHAQHGNWRDASRYMAGERVKKFTGVLHEYNREKKTNPNLKDVELIGGKSGVQTWKSYPNPRISDENRKMYSDMQQSHYVQGTLKNLDVNKGSRPKNGENSQLYI